MKPTPRVLLIDDDEGLVSMYKTMLHGEPLEFYGFSKSREAIHFYRHECEHGRPFDLVICDVILDEMTGMSFVKSLLDTGCNAKIVFLTGYDDKDLALASSLLGVGDIWRKPEDGMNIRDKIKDALKMPDSVRSDRREKVGPDQPVSWKVKSPIILYVMTALMIVSVSLQSFLLYRSVYTVGMMRNLNDYVLIASSPDGKKTGFINFSGYIPAKPSAFPPALKKSGEQDVVFRVPATEADKVRVLAKQRNRTYKITIQ